MTEQPAKQYATVLRATRDGDKYWTTPEKIIHQHDPDHVNGYMDLIDTWRREGPSMIEEYAREGKLYRHWNPRPANHD